MIGFPALAISGVVRPPLVITAQLPEPDLVTEAPNLDMVLPGTSETVLMVGSQLTEDQMGAVLLLTTSSRL